MLHTLTIRDLALLEHAEVSLANGFNVISGETGGGKSLVIAAVELLRGARARTDMVRHGAKEARIDGALVLRFGGLSTQAGRMKRAIGDFFRKDYRRYRVSHAPFAATIWIEQHRHTNLSHWLFCRCASKGPERRSLGRLPLSKTRLNAASV